MQRLYMPELLLADGAVRRDAGLLTSDDGTVRAVIEAGECDQMARSAEIETVRLRGRALLPGLANAHSHTFQRLFRARAEGRAVGGDTFWTWREQMYRAAAFVSPESIYDVARVTFLEMLAAGITVVGEFHYVHNDGDGKPYADANELARAVIAAAESVGIRICLLRSAYMRAGYKREPHPGQRRFYESADEFTRNAEELLQWVRGRANVTAGIAPHSIRAVPLEVARALFTLASERKIPAHIHVSEQVGENDACVAEYGRTPIQLFAENGFLRRETTLIHAIHLTREEFSAVAEAGATICSCPTTERNLGDGIFPADVAAEMNIPIAFGTDSQAQIDILEDARQNEYHLRLRAQQRGLLDRIGGREIGDRLFASATAAGYSALGIDGGTLAPGQHADFFTLDLNDLALLGVDEASLISQAVFAGSRAAVRDVAVQGRLVLRDGRHAQQEEICERFAAVEKKFVQQETR